MPRASKTRRRTNRGDRVRSEERTLAGGRTCKRSANPLDDGNPILLVDGAHPSDCGRTVHGRPKLIFDGLEGEVADVGEGNLTAPNRFNERQRFEEETRA